MSAQAVKENAAAPQAPKGESSLASALTTGRALFLLQLMTRLVTFTLNQGLVRLASPDVFGTAAIQFDLVASTILFLSREGVRNALLRGTGGDDTKRGASRDTALAAFPLRLGLGVASGVVAAYLGMASEVTTSQRHFHLSLALYVFSAFGELAIEPLYVAALKEDPPRIRVRVQAEGGMAIVRAVVSFAFLFLRPGDALLGFAVGFAAGQAWLAGRYIVEYGGFSVLPKLLFPDKGAKDDSSRALAMANTRQSVVKHLLTEADRLAVSRISPLGDQGGYAVAMNYGSLVARIVFQPLEETLLLHWSRSLDAASTLPLLQLAIRLSLHLALLLPVFLPPLLPVILPILLPRRYTTETTAAQTLQTYLVAYLPLLSLNGILEAFHGASATPAQVARQARYMIGSSGAFAVALYGFTHITGVPITTEQALIYASCVAMLIRIAYAFTHARAVFSQRGKTLSISSLLPKTPVWVVTALFGTATWAASARLAGGRMMDQLILLFGFGGASAAAALAVIYVMEKTEVAQLGQNLRG